MVHCVKQKNSMFGGLKTSGIIGISERKWLLLKLKKRAGPLQAEPSGVETSPVGTGSSVNFDGVPWPNCRLERSQ